MPTGTLPVAARDIGALMSLGPLHRVGSHPLTLACLVKGVGRPDSIWIDLGYPHIEYQELWRLAYPEEVFPAGCELKPLLSQEEARLGGFKLVQLAVVSICGVGDRFNGEYFVQGTTHKYQHRPGGGYTTSDGRFRYET